MYNKKKYKKVWTKRHVIWMFAFSVKRHLVYTLKKATYKLESMEHLCMYLYMYEKCAINCLLPYYYKCIRFCVCCLWMNKRWWDNWSQSKCHSFIIYSNMEVRGVNVKGWIKRVFFHVVANIMLGNAKTQRKPLQEGKSLSLCILTWRIVSPFTTHKLIGRIPSTSK